MVQRDPTPPAPEEAPPLGSWRRVYAIVLLELAVLIVLFAFIPRILE